VSCVEFDDDVETSCCLSLFHRTVLEIRRFEGCGHSSLRARASTPRGCLQGTVSLFSGRMTDGSTQRKYTCTAYSATTRRRMTCSAGCFVRSFDHPRFEIDRVTYPVRSSSLLLHRWHHHLWFAIVRFPLSQEREREREGNICWWACVSIFIWVSLMPCLVSFRVDACSYTPASAL